MDQIGDYLLPWIISNVVFGLIAIAAWKTPMAGRILLTACFLGASLFNFISAIQTPEIYLGYADLDILQAYRDFILGPFSKNTSLYVILISLGQLSITIGLILGKQWIKIACVGGIIFGLAIAPLGVGSAFPSTVSMALAFYLIGRLPNQNFIWNLQQYRHSPARRFR